MAVTTSIGPGATNMITGHGADMLVADAREALTGLAAAIAGWEVDEAYRQRAVPVSEVSGLESTRRAYAEHVAAKRTQRAYL